MKKLSLVFFLIITTTIFSQDVEDYIYELPYVKHFSYKEYGMQTQCWGAAQDLTGKLYVANYEGLAVFDGVTWKKIPLIWAWSIENFNNTIYIGNSKISYLSTDSLTLKQEVKKIFIDTVKNKISNKRFQISYKTKNGLFFNNMDNLVQIRDKKFVNSFDISEANVFKYNNTIFIQNNDTIKSINNVLLKGVEGLKNMIVLNIFDINNTAYILTSGKNIYSAKINKKNKFILSNLKLEYSLNSKNAGFYDNAKLIDNDIITVLNSGGVFIYNVKTKKELYINKCSNKNIGIVNSISITNNKNIIATTDNGFYLINYKSPIKYLKHSQKLKSIITSFANFNGSMYITTIDGLYKLTKQKISNKYSIKKLNKNYNSFLKLKVHNNKLYVSSRDGVSQVENDILKKVTTDDIAFNFVFSKQYPDLLYVGTLSSLNIYKRINNKYKLIHNINDLSANVNSLIEYKNKLWFIYSNNEIACLSIKDNEFKILKIYDLKSSTLGINIIKNRLFVTSEDGKMSHYYDYKTDKFLPWEKFINQNNGNPIYYFSYTKIDENTYYAISSKEKLVTKIELSDSITQFINKPFRNIGADQYFGTYFDSISNKLFLGGAGFVLTIDNKNNSTSNLTNFKTYIRKVIINDTVTKQLNVLNRNSKIKFLFSSNNLYKSEQTTFSYKLIGYDNKWSDWSKEAFAQYTKLSYGNYSFKVKSKNILGDISNIYEYSFRINPAFYQTIIAKIIGFLLLILIIYFIVYLNSKRLKTINQKLEKQVQERTKEIKNQNIELEKLSIVAKETDNSVLIYDAEGNLEWINEGKIKNFGYTLEQIWENFGKNILEISFNPKINEVIIELRKNKKSIHYNTSGFKQNGDLIWTRTSLTPILDDNNNIKKIIAIDSDITEIKQAEKKIHLQNTLINQSIEYARRIQTAVLPAISELKQNTKDTFILYKPKDIVSGDFYWFFTKNEKTIIVSSDCTGHGVPGGFMSMIGNTILNNIVKEKGVFDPNIILDYLNEKINSIVNKNSETGQTDGMDISIALIDRKNNILELASANQNIFIVKNNEVIEFYGDIWSIGGAFNKNGENSFTSKKYTLNEITHIYFSTDGYYDQFGGEEDRKLMKDIFIDLIIKNYKLPMENQKIIFDEYLNNWIGKSKQTDDIQVIGILL